MPLGSWSLGGAPGYIDVGRLIERDSMCAILGKLSIMLGWAFWWCSCLWNVPTPISLICQAGAWHNHYIGLLWNAYLGWTDGCVASLQRKYSHNNLWNELSVSESCITWCSCSWSNNSPFCDQSYFSNLVSPLLARYLLHGFFHYREWSPWWGWLMRSN